jgi:predicted phage-related endonuclease
MPDITKKTVSASQMAALFNLSPYATRWMLYQNFANDMPLDVKENERMDWGTRVERLILQHAADELRVDILPHDQGEYLRHPDAPIGCTPDGYCFDPQLGLGFVEAKNIDWLRWRDTWEPDRAADHVEVQVQTQMMVPHPVHGLPKWGCIATLVGGNEMLLYKREPIGGVQDAILRETTLFLSEEVAKHQEPDVLGSAIELPALLAAYPRAVPPVTLTEADFDDPKQAIALARLIDAYMIEADRASTSKKEVDRLKAQLLGIVGDASGAIVHGRMLELTSAAIKERTQLVKAHVQTRFKGRLLNLAADLDKLDPPPSDADYLPGNVFA